MWNAGYVTEIGYTHGYYRELNPVLARWSLLLRGFEPPGRGAYLELGFGQGLSLAIHAAASPGTYWGCDFNPAHAAHAAELAAVSKSGLVALDDSFGEFIAREDLPPADYVMLHGIWSWVSDERRREIVEIVRRKLNPGGLAYVSYNSTPGWAPKMPIRHLMALHSRNAGEGKPIAARLDDALAFAKSLKDAGAGYFKANPGLGELLDKMIAQPRSYLAHEYLNRNWDPMPFSEVAEWFEAGKVEFATSAHGLDYVDGINLTPDMRKLLDGIANPIMRESMRDYCVNQQFRRDFFLRGARRLSRLEQGERLMATRLVLTAHPDSIELTVQGALGKATMSKDTYSPVIDALASDNLRPKTVAQLAAPTGGAGVPLPSLLEVITILVGAGHAQPAQDDETVAKARPACARLNAHLIERARDREEVSHLASPVTGGGVAAPRFHQLFLKSLASGKQQPADWAQYVWSVLAAQGRRLVKDGKAIEKPEDNVAELTRQAQEFATRRLPVLRALGIA
jgi:SAM-dependent methyltransferase